MLLKSIKKIDYHCNFPLRDLTTFKIGGYADYFFYVTHIEDLFYVLDFLKKENKKIYILGGGSNILVNDGRLEAGVIRLKGEFEKINYFDGGILEVGGGVRLSSLIRFCLQKELSGLENFVGIPGTVGGMVVMNASSFGKEFSNLVEKVEVVDYAGGSTKIIDKSKIEFFYRGSNLKGFIVSKVKMRLNRSDKETIKSLLRCYWEKKNASQILDYPSCGCVFKNPKDFFAGELIEKANLKGYRRNGAMVSLKHANFIINLGDAKAEDVGYIIEFVKQSVYDKFGILLEEEIIKWT